MQGLISHGQELGCPEGNGNSFKGFKESSYLSHTDCVGQIGGMTRGGGQLEDDDGNAGTR